MKKVLLILGIAVLVLGAYIYSRIQFYIGQVQESTQIACIGSLHSEYILIPPQVEQLTNLGQDYDITSAGSVILLANNQILEIKPSGSGNTIASQNLNDQTVDSFALDDKGDMLAVSQGYFGMLGEDGAPIHAVPLPYNNARLARSVQEGTVYLWGGDEGQSRLYSFLEDGRYQILLQSEEPIVGVADTDGAVFVATATGIFEVTPSGPIVLFKAPAQQDWGPIVSLAGSPDEGLLFFSTPTRVYALENGVALSIINNSGGVLRSAGDKLYVFDHTRNLLYDVYPVTHALFAEGAP